MYKRILVPVDGSSNSRRGLREAIRLARNQLARLCLLHVVEEFFVVQTGEAVIFAEDMFRAMRASGRKILSRAAESARKQGVRPRTVLVESIAMPVADVIVRSAPAPVLLIRAARR